MQACPLLLEEGFGGVVVEGFCLVTQEERGFFASCHDDLADRGVERDALAIDEQRSGTACWRAV